jgi:hypothetical protein
MDKRVFEKQIVDEMILMYYTHEGRQESEECRHLREYAAKRTDNCPFMASKTFCSQCSVHCYGKVEKEQIRQVMRWSGPRLIFKHPILVMKHAYYQVADKGIGRVGWLLLGFAALGLGFLGAVLPLLPAFPFLLTAAVAFSKSSQRLHDWFLSTKLYKDNLQDWVQHRSMTKRAKIRVMTVITLTMMFGFVMMHRVWIGQLVLVIVWICHVVYFIKGIKTLPALQ